MRARVAIVVAVLTLGGALGSFGPIASASAAPGAWSGTASLQNARSSQTATRLYGGKVLAVGGVQAGQPLASAELYDPSSAAWTTTAGLSAARSSHTATLLPDRRVVVVGGRGIAGTPLASTEIYNPTTGTWSAGGALSTARSSHTATLLSTGQILVVGGVGADGKPLASAELFNPTTGIWTATGSLSTARSAHTATLLADGKVLVAGGTDIDGKPLASAELYSASAGSWSATGAMAVARGSHTATALGDQTSGGGDPRVLATGGIGSDGSRQVSAELYDESTGAWTNTGALTVGRSSHTATLLPNGRVLVAAGTGPGASPGGFAELYDPATAHWSLTGSLASARTSHTATVLLTGRVLVTGGAGTGGASLDSAELYEPDLGARWQPTASLTDARSGHTATLLPNGDVLVAGGQRTTTAGTPPRIIDPLTSAELYHPASGTWTTTGSLARARSFQTATLLQGSPSQCGNNCGKVLVAGGIGADSSGTGRSQTVASAELYDPATGTWSATAPMTTARAIHTATLLPSGKVLVVAGAGPGGAEPRNANQLASAELYDPAAGTWTATGSLTGTTTPPASNTPRGARLGHSAALLDKGACGSQCGKVLIAAGVGGVGTGPALSSAELYDPGTGTFTATASLNQARQGQSTAVLPNGKALIVGGEGVFSSAPPIFNTGEIYDPGTGTWSASGALGARRYGSTATVLTNDQVMITGGVAGGNAPAAPNIPGSGLFASELFDSNANAWSPTSFLNTARVYHTATLLPSGPSSVCGSNCGKVLVAGGNAEIVGTFAPYFDLQSPVGSAELYAPASPGPGQGPGQTGQGLTNPSGNGSTTTTTTVQGPTARSAAKALGIAPTTFFAAGSGPSATGAAARRSRRTGARVSYTLNVAASVRFTIERSVRGRLVSRRCVAERKSNHKRRRCTRYVRLRGSFTRQGKAGRNSFHFTGRLNGKKLRRGGYRLVATPTANGRTGTPARRTFGIRG